VAGPARACDVSAVSDAPLRPWLRALVLVAATAASAAIVPRAWCGRDAGAWLDGSPAEVDALARGVTSSAGDAAGAFHTGSARFDGEWALVTQQMTVLGLGQIALARPDRRAELLPAMEAAARRMLAPEACAFGAEAWGERGLEALGTAGGHAYLGYVALALGMLRKVDPATPLAARHDALVASLARRLAASPHALLETYPGETYPADVAAVAGAIGLHAEVASIDRRALLSRWSATMRERCSDPGTGMLFQQMDAFTGAPAGPPRASGTALAVYFASFADPALARDLWRAVGRQRRSVLGFGGVRERAPGDDGPGDVDSGPVVLGVSVSATGFALAGARMFGDRAAFTELWRTADLFGVPVVRPSRSRFLTGGPLGNALLLALATAPRVGAR
jgi:hypothetical protein